MAENVVTDMTLGNPNIGDVVRMHQRVARSLGEQAAIAETAAEMSYAEVDKGLKELSAQLLTCVHNSDAEGFKMICEDNEIEYYEPEVDFLLGLPSAESTRLLTSSSINFVEGDTRYLQKGYEPVYVEACVVNGKISVSFTLLEHPSVAPGDEQISMEPWLYNGVITDPADILRKIMGDYTKLADISGGETRIKNEHLQAWTNTTRQALDDIRKLDRNNFGFKTRRKLLSLAPQIGALLDNAESRIKEEKKQKPVDSNDKLLPPSDFSI